MMLFTSMLEKNACYITASPIEPCGIMVHSTGANNPRLNRYCIVPNEKVNPNNWNQYTPSGKQVCVHAFIGKLQDGTVATCQTLPWTIKGWHSGSGSKGSANNLGYIGFEICEDDLTNKDYFDKVYKEAVELTAYLCEKFKLDPLKDGVVICHSEGYKRGIASNHADVMHWFSKFGKTMDDFRRDVNEILISQPVLNEYQQWCVDNKIFVGRKTDSNKPKYDFDKPITRGEVAIVLKRLYDLIKTKFRLSE